MSDEQPRYYRVVASIAIGTIVGWLSYRLTGASGGDFGYPWRAAGWVLDGKSPYANMTPSAAYGVGGPFLYPYWTALAVAPFRLLHDPRVAAAVFEGLSSAILSYIVTARGWLMLALFLSAPFYWSLQTANWPPLLLAAALGRGTAWLGAVKPNLGAVVLAYRPEKATFIGGAVLMAASLAISPGWPLEWLAHIRAQPVQHIPAVLWPAGALGLLGALRWRTREGRALCALTVVPTASLPYDWLMLWLACRTGIEAALLTAATWVTWLVLLATGPHDLTRAWTSGHLILALGWIGPVAAMVLRRPNADEALPSD